MENEAFFVDTRDSNHKELENNEVKNGFSEQEKQRTGRKFSVKLKQNTFELSALSKALPSKNYNDEADSLIGIAVRHGRRSLITREIEKAKRNKNLECLDSAGFTALHHTTRYCRLEAIENLLRSGADVNVKSRDDHFTPLHIAARFGWYKASEILLSHGADASLQSSSGATPLHLTCRKGNSRLVELLLRQNGVVVNAKDKSLRTPLHIAASQGYEKVVEILLENGADVFSTAVDRTTPIHMALVNDNTCELTGSGGDISIAIMRKALEVDKLDDHDLISLTSDMDGYSILHITAGSCNTTVMEMVLDCGVNIDLPNTKNMKTALHIACKKNSLRMVAFLVERGADIHATDVMGQTPLHHAAKFGRREAVKLLLEKGADVESRDNSNSTPFLLAVSSTKTNIGTIQVLIDKGADIHASEAFMKNCLHLAVENDNCEMVGFLLGIDHAAEDLLNCPDVAERVPLHYAAKNSSLKILNMLLTKQRRLNFQDEDQYTPMYLAAKADRADHVEALGRAGAAVNDRDEEGKTSLHVAALNGSKKVCKTLIALGADVNCKDSRERTPLMFAAEEGCTKTVKALLKLHANIDDASVDGDTALLVAIRNNNSAVVQLLMDREVDVSYRDLTGAGVFETAAKFDAKDSVNVIASHDRWKEVLNVTSSAQGHRPMELLIKHFPVAASAVMDKCIKKSTNILHSHEDYKVTYDLELLDPGPDDFDFTTGNRYFGPTVMVKNKHQDLLLHPLTQMLLEKKWCTYGKHLYYISFLLYMFFMAFYSYVVITERAGFPERRQNATTVSQAYSIQNFNSKNIAWMVVFFSVFQLLKEVFQILLQRLNYFKQPGNYIEWVLYSTCIIFLMPFVGSGRFVNWFFEGIKPNPQSLWGIALLSIVLTYVNFVLFLRRFSFFGIYINMFLVVFRSLIKVMLVFAEFIVAFAAVFFILFREQASFGTFASSLLKTLSMTIGEVDFSSTFIDSLNQTQPSTGFPLNPFPEMAFTFYTFFVYAMCITLMNLLIGLAIGDIDTVQRNAELQRLAMQVEFVAQIEEKFPRFISRRLYQPFIEVMPNKKTFTWRIHMIRRLFQGALKDFTSTTGEKISEHEELNLNEMATTLEKNKRQIKALNSAMEEQTSMMRLMAEKIDTLLVLERESSTVNELGDVPTVGAIDEIGEERKEENEYGL